MRVDKLVTRKQRLFSSIGRRSTECTHALGTQWKDEEATRLSRVQQTGSWGRSLTVTGTEERTNQALATGVGVRRKKKKGLEGLSRPEHLRERLFVECSHVCVGDTRSVYQQPGNVDMMPTAQSPLSRVGGGGG
ncbi:hypothetical protein C0Q70_18967 [Pomacea canaliculata]|uniref:Uncharacterized protein n=1 Tax=Pomacea canaliculata TaxID=400727 RepID=A0A2T7NI29_POMCA|nr:hypothetical protein C0Q70_18967 [Pomacea canaliculata]